MKLKEKVGSEVQAAGVRVARQAGPTGAKGCGWGTRHLGLISCHGMCLALWSGSCYAKAAEGAAQEAAVDKAVFHSRALQGLYLHHGPVSCSSPGLSVQSRATAQENKIP